MKTHIQDNNMYAIVALNTPTLEQDLELFDIKQIPVLKQLEGYYKGVSERSYLVSL